MSLSITLLTAGNAIAADEERAIFSRRDYPSQPTMREFKAKFDADREQERKDALKAEVEAFKARLAMIEEKKARIAAVTEEIASAELSVAERIAAFEAARAETAS